MMLTDLQNRTKELFLVTMTESGRMPVSKRVAAHRAQQAAAGRLSVNTYMPADLLAEMDRLKEQRGVSSRAVIFEEAVRAYIENNRA